jgi:WD40 repeat protein
VRVWDAATGELSAVLPGHARWVRALAYAADSRVLASCGTWDCTVQLWERTSGKPRQEPRMPLPGDNLRPVRSAMYREPIPPYDVNILLRGGTF